MGADLHHFKVCKAIVCGVPIAMVDNFPRLQFAAKVFLHDLAMFTHLDAFPAALDPEPTIAAFVHPPLRHVSVPWSGAFGRAHPLISLSTARQSSSNWRSIALPSAMSAARWMRASILGAAAMRRASAHCRV